MTACSSLQFILFDITSWFAFVLLSTEWKVLKGTVMQIEKALINDRLNVSNVSPENFAFQLFIILQ